MNRNVKDLIAEGHNINERGGPREGELGCLPCQASAGCDFLGPHDRDGWPLSEAQRRQTYSYIIWAA